MNGPRTKSQDQIAKENSNKPNDTVLGNGSRIVSSGDAEAILPDLHIWDDEGGHVHIDDLGRRNNISDQHLKDLSDINTQTFGPLEYDDGELDFSYAEKVFGKADKGNK